MAADGECRVLLNLGRLPTFRCKREGYEGTEKEVNSKITRCQPGYPAETRPGEKKLAEQLLCDIWVKTRAAVFSTWPERPCADNSRDLHAFPLVSSSEFAALDIHRNER